MAICHEMKIKIHHNKCIGKRDRSKEGMHMTSQENLPVWAKILLGIPVGDETVSDNNRRVSDSQQGLAPREPQERSPRVHEFGTAPGKRKRAWQGLMCPMPVKVGS